jgi:hypothetical protein
MLSGDPALKHYLDAFGFHHPAQREDPYVAEIVGAVDAADHRSGPRRKQDAEQYAKYAFENGFGLDTYDATLRHAYEATSPAAQVQGSYIYTMRHRALTYLKDSSSYETLCKIPVLMLPTGLLNGQACLNPSDEPVIMIDSGMTRQLSEVMHGYQGYLTWGFGKDAHCLDHSQLDFAQTLVGLTGVILSGDNDLIKQLCPARIDACPSVRPNSKQREHLFRWAYMARDFVMLHEYGHILLGHLNSAEIESVTMGPKSARILKSRHTEEYAADSFAVRAFIDAHSRDYADIPTDYFVWTFGEPIGVLLRFWDLMDAIVRRAGGRLPGSHPPAISRWKRIYAELAKIGIKKDFLSDTEYMFDTILQTYGLEDANSRLN